MFKPGGLHFGFAVTDFPSGVPVSGSFVSALVPLRDNDLVRCFGLGGEGNDIGEELVTEMGGESGTEMGEDLVTEMGEALKGLFEMCESLKGLFETGTLTPSVDEPGLRPGRGGTSPRTPLIATTCCCCRLGGVFGGGGDSNCASKSRRRDGRADENGELFLRTSDAS